MHTVIVRVVRDLIPADVAAADAISETVGKLKASGWREVPDRKFDLMFMHPDVKTESQARQWMASADVDSRHVEIDTCDTDWTAGNDS